MPAEHDHDLGLTTTFPADHRRRAVGVLPGGAGAALFAACGGSAGRSQATTGRGAVRGLRDPRGDRRPVPGDGSNGPNVLDREWRRARGHHQELRRRLGCRRRRPDDVRLTLLDVAGGGKPLAGAAVYLWHCDQPGPLLALRRGDRRRELPARRPGGRRRRQGQLQDDLPGRLPRAAGRTSTSRSTRASTRRPRAAQKLRTSQLAIPQDCDARRTRTRATSSPSQNLAAAVAGRRHGLQRRLPSQLATVRQRRRRLTLTLNVGV